MSDAVHTFLPWTRRGLASQIADDEIFDGINAPGGFGPTDVRGKINAYVHINNGTAGSPINVPLQIVGPGDVIGIHQDVIIKTEPRPWITNFEPHSFPYIDFYEEDFPWRYSPAKPKFDVTDAVTGKLRPWITLIVLKEDEFERATVENGPLNAIKLDDTVAPADRPLPEVDELWAWAHVSVDNKLTGNLNTALNAAVNANPNIAISRIICPRKLEDNTSYYAFLIPTYESGRLSGLGKIVPSTLKAQKPSWDHSTAWTSPNADEPWLFPIYHEWYFRTGATGDFEYLVRQLKPKPLDLKVGRRMMDISSPGYGITFNAGTANVNQGTETLEGALRVPGNASSVFADFYDTQNQAPLQPPRTAANVLRDKIKDFVNLGEDMLVTPSSNSYYLANQGFPNITDDQDLFTDPIVAPPLYGRWHALRSKVDPADGALNWLNELNLDPRYRVAAGLGAEYVKKRQEFLMQKAWEQVGPIIEANTAARLAQLAQATADALHQRHINQQPMAQLLPMTNRVHGRILTGSITLEQKAIDSSLPNSAPSSTFRKLTSPNSTLTKRTNPTINQAGNNVMENMRVGGLKPVAPKAQPGQNAVSFSLSSLTQAVTAIQGVNTSNVNFNVTVPGGGAVTPSTTVAANFKSAMAPYANVFDSVNWPAPTPQANLTTPVVTITDSINPRLTHTRSFYDSVYVSNQPPNTPVPDVIVPVMTAPSFHLPMYESLKELGLDYFVPNLNLIPQNSVTIFESNQKFIESFMVGANYEMGRELLWREYPTDQRGTYFKHFWGGLDSGQSESATRDIKPINEWVSNTALGTHNGRTGNQGNPMVLAIRGDFLKKFPTATIYAVKALWDTTTHPSDYWDHPRLLSTNLPTDMKLPTFSAKVNPDITFLGFDMTAATARGNRNANAPATDAGWFIVFQERPGELRFGLDFPQNPSNSPQLLVNWNDLSWGEVAVNGGGYLDLTTVPGFEQFPIVTTKKLPVGVVGVADVEWAEDSGAMAMILYQNPIKAAIHCYEMIP